MQRRWVPALTALAAALVVAEVGVLVFWPEGGVVRPDDVAASAYFTPEQISRAADFRGPQVWLYLAGMLLELAVLALLVARPPRLLREQGGRGAVLRRVTGAAAALSLLLTLVGLPLAAVGRQRGIDVGLVTRSWPGWAQDVMLGAAIQAGLMALTALALVGLMRRLPRWWWLPASGVVVAGAAAVLYLTPVVLDPLFNRFTPVQGPVRTEVLTLAERAGVDVGEVYVVDASRRTTAANAYVAGFGPTKRVVVYDNLLERFSADELRLVLAHELAHQRYDDVPRGLLYVLLVAPFGMLAVARLTAASGPERSPAGTGPRRLADARTLPALALSLSLVVPAVTTISNQLSRRVEARADSFALQLTDAPKSFIAFKRRATVRNVSEPDPSGPSRWLFGTHPTPLERIGAAEAWARGVRPRPARRAPVARRPVPRPGPAAGRHGQPPSPPAA